MGSHYPAAALLNDLFHEKYKSPLPLKLHVIGHSYGAKLAALASIEAIRRWELQQSMRGANEIPLESLLLISPAMRPGDLFYVVDVKVFQFLKSALLFLFHPEDVQKEDLAALRPPDIADVEYLLKQIPRKGILYSNYDYPNGLYFDITQFVLNSSEMHRLQADLHSHGQDLESLTPSSQPLNLLYRSIFGVYWHLYKPIALVGGLGTSVGYSSLSWIIAKLINVPSDFVYHVRHNQTFPQTTTGTLKAAGYVFNALHFFMPLDRLLWPGQPADQLGLFRLTRPALGRGGLIKASNGRWLLLNAFPLQNFIENHSDIPSETFCKLATKVYGGSADLPDNAPAISQTQIYSFDASTVFSGGQFSPSGSHGDVGSRDLVNCDPLSTAPGIQKREYSANFIFNFTKVLPISNETAFQP